MNFNVLMKKETKQLKTIMKISGNKTRDLGEREKIIMAKFSAPGR